MAGLPATHHIRAGIPAMKMRKPRKYPRICFIRLSYEFLMEKE
jgi:hypothetical protein